MGFAFQKKSAPALNKNVGVNKGSPQGSNQPPKKVGAVAPKGFIKKGAQAVQLAQKEEQERELRKSLQGKGFRFRLQDGEERQVTFLDGDIDEDGGLSAACYYEHNVKQGQNFLQIACVEDTDEGVECPLCKEGTFPKYFAAALTVIDHKGYTVKAGPNAGKEVKNPRRLYVCKHETYKQLSKIAAKRGGLAGCTFDISRSGSKSPSAGSQFDFVEKTEDGEVLMQKYGLSEDELAPLNYEEEITYLPPEDMIQAGLGVEVHGHGTTQLGKEKKVSEDDYQNEL